MFESSATFFTRLEQSARAIQSVITAGGRVHMMLPGGRLCRVGSVAVSDDQLQVNLIDETDSIVYQVYTSLGYPQFSVQFSESF